MTIPIYQSELAVAGLADKIQQQTSVAYLSPVIFDPIELERKVVAEAINKLSLASVSDKDLYITRSILVSTNWNKNDDVFDIQEVWGARYTPIHKPTNIGHDEHQICGHITGVWAIADEDGSIVPDNIHVNDLPSLYHLVNAAVIYKNWTDQVLIDRTEKLISEIKEGKKFVSMEALFSNFDYATYKDDINELKIITRAEDTAWMTKHLRAYGGSGEYEGHKIGRLLRNIVFCGKGYVDKPANPNSIIFASLVKSEVKEEDIKKKNDKNDKNNIILENTVYNNNDNNRKLEGEKMTSEELKVKNDELESKIKEMESDIAKIKQDLDSANKTIVAKDEDIASAQEKITQAQEKINQLERTNSELAEQIEQIKANELKTNRISKLVDGGIDKVEAEKKVDLFSVLSDEQFDVLAKELIDAAKIIKDGIEAAEKDKNKDKSKDKNKEDMDEDEQDSKGEDSVESVESEDVENKDKDGDADLAASAEEVDDNELNDVRKELAEAIASVLGKKQKK